MSDKEKEFLVLNLNMPKIGFAYGFFLIIWGFLVSLLSESESMTSLIPTILGIPVLLFSFLSIIIPKKQKIFMHIVVLFGLIIFFGGVDLIIKLILAINPFLNFWTGLSKLMMISTGFVFCFFCIQSFRFARKYNIKNTKI